MELRRAREEHRPWGGFLVLDEQQGYKVKRIEILPRQRLSYQLHKLRDEHWVIVQGEARITLDGRVIELSPGQAIDIPRQAAHRIANRGDEPLIFIEVQRGGYFGEDDILRLEDDYGRVERNEKPIP